MRLTEEQPEPPAGPATGTMAYRPADERWQACPPPALPTDRPRPERSAGRGDVIRARLSDGSVSALAEFGRRQGVSLHSLLFGIHGWLLGQWSGQPRVLLTTPLTSRHHAAADDAVGHFADTVPVPVDLAATDLVSLAGQVQPAMLNALDRPPSATPNLSGHVSFTVEHSAGPGLVLDGVRALPRFAHTGSAKFDLATRVELTETGAGLLVEYDTELFDRQTVRRLVAHYLELVDTVAADPERGCASWPTTPAQDRAALRRLECGPVREVRGSVVERIARFAGSAGGIAVREGRRSLDYPTLWRAAGGLAVRLKRSGVKPGDLVAVSVPASMELVIAVLGILRCGAAFVPLDPRDPTARRRAIVERAGIGTLVGSCDWPGWPGSVLVPDGSDGDASGELPIDPPHPHAVAYVTHTSGSTGAPKGVLTTHRGLANYLDWAVLEYGLAPGTETPLHTSVAYDLAMTSLLGPLVAGGTVHVVAESAAQHAVVRAGLAGYQLVKATPTHMDALLGAESRRGPMVAVLGGENIGASFARRLRTAMPDTRIINEYGPTETVVGSTAWRLPADGYGPGFLPIGTPIANTTVRVLDPMLRRLPVGVWGELVIGGHGVSHGYLGASAATAERFVPDPDGRRGERLYRTGDVARWTKAGTLELRGRIDAQVKISGYRVEPGEIEAAVGSAPGVRRAAVRLYQGPPWRIVAFATPSDVDVESIWTHLRDRLPAHMMPDAVVPLDKVPLNANGKLDPSALPEPSVPWAPSPGADADLRQVVHDAWCAVLGVKSVPHDRRFFDAGGNSLMLLRLERELAARGLGSITVTDLFQHPTIDGLADLVLGASGDQVASPSMDGADRRTARSARRARIGRDRDARR